MLSANSVRRGLRHFVGGRLASGLLGVIWLALLVRVLERSQLGVYFGVMAIFEIAQSLSSVGVLSYAQRYLPAAWVHAPRVSFLRTIAWLSAWRCSTLLILVAAFVPTWDWASSKLGWPSQSPALAIVAGYIVLEGCARFFDLLLESTVSQGVSQLLGVLRNAARIGILHYAQMRGFASPIDAAWVLKLELSLSLAYVVLAGLWMLRLALQVPSNRGEPPIDQRARMRFALQGYASLAIGSLIGGESVRLILSHLAGPAVLGVVGFALSLVDVVRRYMPANLFLGFVRAVLTGRAEAGSAMSDTLFRIRLLMRVNGIFLIGASAWLLVYGDAALRAFTSRSGLAEAAAYVTVLMGMLFVQAVRLMATLVAHVRSDNLSVAYATLSIAVGPILVVATVPWLGGMGAVLALLAQEVAYSWVLVWRLGLGLADLCGAGWGWLRMVMAGAMAAGLAAAVGLLFTGIAAVVIGSLAFAAAYVLIQLRWPTLSSEEVKALKSAIRSRKPAG